MLHVDYLMTVHVDVKITGCIPPTDGAIFNHSAGQSSITVQKTHYCASVKQNEIALPVVQTVCKLPKNNIWYLVKKR